MMETVTFASAGSAAGRKRSAVESMSLLSNQLEPALVQIFQSNVFSLLSA